MAIDLAALKRWADHLAPYVEDDNEWYRRGGIDGKDAGEIGELFAEVYAELSRHVSPQPSPNRAALVERMARDIWDASDGYVTRIPWPPNGLRKSKSLVQAEAALAAVEAAGWEPRPEPVTAGERETLTKVLREEHGRIQAFTMYERFYAPMVDAVLTSDVLRSRGITVEGEK